MLRRGGPNPMEKRRTFTPTALANRKWPSSWTNPRAPSGRTKPARFWGSTRGSEVNRRWASSQRTVLRNAQECPNRDDVQVHRGRIEEEGIHPVEQPPVTWDQLSRVLHPVGPLEQGLAEIPERTEHRPEHPQGHAVDRGQAVENHPAGH